MNEKYNLTVGNVTGTLVKFALPYLLACFMQTLYGMADLFVVGLFNDSSTTTAVSIGSQLTHMLTVMIIGFAMGTTVVIGHAVGAGNKKLASKAIGTSAVFFIGFAAVLTALMLVLSPALTSVMMTPAEAVSQTNTYIIICFAGIPFITAYNVLTGIFRGAGDSKSPMYFVGIACILNIALDFLFIGCFGMGAAGAALGTVIGQAVSSIISFVVLLKKDFGFSISKEDLKPDFRMMGRILKIGTPIAFQDTIIQISFLIITVIANSRGLICSAGVGITEKIICFMFLVPSAFLSAISAMTAQNIGAGKLDRAHKALRSGLIITVCFGLICFLYCQFLPHTLVGIFTSDASVRSAGAAYLQSYSIDCIMAAIHFCFSGYFCGTGKSLVSFIHNLISMVLIRVPGAIFASIYFPESLYPMGLAAPLGSLLSALICAGVYIFIFKKEKRPPAEAV